MLTPICPICGGQVVEKEVEKIVKGGNDVAILRVKAGVCEKCGGLCTFNHICTFIPRVALLFKNIVKVLHLK